LVELFEQPKPDKVMENPVDNTLTSLIEQPEPQRINVSHAPISQLWHSPEQVHFETEQPTEAQSSLVFSSLPPLLIFLSLLSLWLRR
jgi:hypothetical protein